MPHKDAFIDFVSEGIPASLKAADRWAPWRPVWNERRNKWGKVPHRADNPNYGLSSAKPEQWFSYDAAIDALRRCPDRFSGVGYCMTGPHGVIAVDLDNCVDELGVLADWAQTVVDALASYTEFSPSGRGLRIMALGATPFDWTNHDVGIEVYGGHEARFLTITGAHVPGTATELRAVPGEVLQRLAGRYARERKKAEVIDLTIPDLLDELALPDLADLPLSESVLRFLENGETDGDRSASLHAAGVALYAAGLDDAVVLSLLANNPWAMGVALDHRRQDSERALLYLWREHCVKAKPKARAIVASPDEFDVIDLCHSERAKELPPFRRDKQGSILATVENVTLAVRRADICGVEIRFDTFRDEILLSAPGQGAWQPFTDADYVRLRIALERGGFKPIGRELIRDVVLLVASENPFDSAIEWLESLSWDGTPRIEQFLCRYFGAEDSGYSRAVSSYLWSALAGRVLAPGCKADMVPILVGEQGIRKSTAVAALVPAPEFFTEVSFNEKDDDLSRRMRGRLVAEIGELRGLHTKELESIKAFITRTHENWIPKYREFAVQFPRRLVFVGTTNKDEFLADETGNRRWLPVRVAHADVESIEADRNQLWAEARELFTRSGVVFKGAETMAAQAHAEHSISDSWEDAISRWLDEPEALTGEKPRDRKFLRVADVLEGALGFNPRNITRKEEVRVGAVLRTLGFTRKKVRIDGRALWAFVPLVPLVFPSNQGL